MNTHIELWHDTTMWNEGFERAREPFTEIVIAAADLAGLRSWLDSWNAGAGDENSFVMREHESSKSSVALPLAIAVLEGAISTWGGI